MAFYKIDINKSKLEYSVRPFATGVSDAKRQLNRLVAEFKEKHLQVNDDEIYAKSIKKDMGVFTLFIKQFRSIAHQFQQTYGYLNKYVLTLSLRQIRNEIKAKRVPSLGLLIAYTEISYYIFSLDMHTTASCRLCSILDCLVSWSKTCKDKIIEQELQNRIRREAKRILDIYTNEKCESNVNMEALNLLITLNWLIGYKLTIEQIELLFGINCDEDSYNKLNYFQICTLLYLIENDKCYQTIKNNLEEEIVRRVSSPQDLRKSENAHLFFDMMTCPYIEKRVGMRMVKNATGVDGGKAYTKRSLLAKPKRWFFDWDMEHVLAYILNKKEYHSPYE